MEYHTYEIDDKRDLGQPARHALQMSLAFGVFHDVIDLKANVLERRDQLVLILVISSAQL